MTDKEKIEEIVIDAFEGWSKVGFTDEEMIAILSKLAEWKDQQFKEYLEKKKEEMNLQIKYTSEGCFPYVMYKTMIDIIINEFFKEDKK